MSKEPEYTPLTPGEIAALKALENETEGKIGNFLKGLIGKLGRTEGNLIYVTIQHTAPYRGGSPEQSFIGMTKDGEFFSINDTLMRLDVLPGDFDPKFSLSDPSSVLRALKLATHWETAESGLREEVKAFLKEVQAPLAEKMESVLQLQPVPDDPEYPTAAYRMVGKNTLRVRKASEMNKDGVPSYMVNSGTEPAPLSAFNNIISMIDDQERARKRG